MATPNSIRARARCRMINEGRHKDEFVFTLLDGQNADHGEIRVGIANQQLRDTIDVDTKVELTIRPTDD